MSAIELLIIFSNSTFRGLLTTGEWSNETKIELVFTESPRLPIFPGQFFRSCRKLDGMEGINNGGWSGHASARHIYLGEDTCPQRPIVSRYRTLTAFAAFTIILIAVPRVFGRGQHLYGISYDTNLNIPMALVDVYLYIIPCRARTTFSNRLLTWRRL